MLQLIVEKGADKGKAFPITQEGYFTIGRAVENEMVIEDENVSREHCRFRLKDDKLHVQDLKSRNGTQVNFRSLVKPMQLQVGDMIQLGETELMVSDEEDDPLIGSEIQNYKILNRLGRGGGGTVYLGRQLNLDREVAIKVLSPKLALEKKYRDNFVIEARQVAALNHHRVIGVFDIVEQDDIVFFSMEYMSNGSLGELAVEEKKLPIDLVVGYMKQAAEGLAYLQETNTVHRDIKPANLMLDKEMDLKLGDFGTAIDESAVTEGNVMGSPSFMSPEQIEGKNIDGRSDLYSLGCTAFRLMSGMPPFFGRTVKEILSAHLNEDPPSFKVSVPEMSEELAGIFDKLLIKDPNERFENAEAFIYALDNVDTSVETVSTKKKKKKRKRSGRRTSPNRIIRKKRP